MYKSFLRVLAYSSETFLTLDKQFFCTFPILLISKQNEKSNHYDLYHITSIERVQGFF